MRQLLVLRLIVLLVLCCEVFGSPQPPSVRLALVTTIDTVGCSGFKYFHLNGTSYLAVANFWDGISRGMAGTSQLLEIATRPRGGVELIVAQEFSTKGAHGWDYFETAEQTGSGSHSFLVVPNYYGCGSDRGPAADDCQSTVVYRATRHRKDPSRHFVLHQSLATAGPAQTTHFTTPSGRTFLVVGENFNHEVCLFELRSSRFHKHRCLTVHGAGATAAVSIGTRVYLICTSYHSSLNGWATKSPIYVADVSPEAEGKGPPEFSLLQEIETFGCHDAAYAMVGGQHLVLLAQDRSSRSPRINSTILVFNATTQLFDVLQSISTHGAHGGVIFEGPDRRAYVFVANFGDRKKKKYKAMSTLWQQDGAGATAPFLKVAEVLTYGATSAAWFMHAGRHFLAVASEGDLHALEHQGSGLYELIIQSN
jgi:hypothetical protein